MTMLTDPELYKNNLLDYLKRRTSSPLETYPFLNIEAIKNISIFERDTHLNILLVSQQQKAICHHQIYYDLQFFLIQCLVFCGLNH